ncbi:MAG: YdbH domain-containing protein [Desulfamplus sp.]|nr:YdbH domain-containing protein [Desulfamplus sp.]
MSTETNTMLKSILKTVLWVSILALISVFILLPPIAERLIVEKTAAIAGLDRFDLKVRTIGISGIGVDKITTGDSISVDSIFCNYSPNSLMKNRVNSLNISGMEVNGVKRDSSVILTDFSTQNKVINQNNVINTDKKSDIQTQDGLNIKAIAAIIPFLPPIIEISHSVFTLTESDGQSVFTLPFSLMFKIDNKSTNKENSSVINLLFKPVLFGQTIKISVEADIITGNILDGNLSENISNSKDILRSIAISIDNISLSSLRGLFSVMLPDSDIALNGKCDITISMIGDISKWKIAISHVGMAKPIESQINNFIMNLTITDLERLLQASTVAKTSSVNIGNTIKESSKDSTISSQVLAEGSFRLNSDMLSSVNVIYNFRANQDKTWSFFIKGDEIEKKRPFIIGSDKQALKLNSPNFEISCNGNSASFDGKLTVKANSLSYDEQKLQIGKIDLNLPFKYVDKGKKFTSEGKLNVDGVAAVPIKSNIQLLKKNIKVDLNYKLNPVKFTPELIKKIYTDPKIFAGMNFSANLASYGDILFYDNKITSSININLDNGKFSMPEKKISINGINTSLSFRGIDDIKPLPAQVLKVDKIDIKDIKISDAQVRYTIESTPNSAVLIENASFNWCDGKVVSESMRFSSGQSEYHISLFCDRLKLSSILKQVGAFDAEGEGTLNGRIPVSIINGDINFNNGFLYSAPGQGGTIKVSGTDKLIAGIPEGTPQFNQLDLAKEALKSYKYEWARLGFDTKGEQLLVKMEFDGKPENVLPFVYKKELGGFVRVSADNAGSNFQGIKLDVNLQLPFNRVLKFGNEMNNLFK